VLVAAVAENGVIGAEGGLPWRLPGDLKRFKALTMGRPLIMGRRTFDSIGRALPGRRNIVITRNPDWRAPGVETAASLQAALSECGGDGEAMVIGGAEIFAAAMPLADRIELTRVHARPAGDTYFPELDEADWAEVAREDIPAEGERPGHAFLRLIRRRR